MKATLCIDDAVGEYRRALLDSDGRPFRLEIERWSERGARAKLDQVRWGRAKARTPGNRGWFVDFGAGPDGILETRAIVVEGALLPVRVKSEAWSDKGPVLSMADMAASVARPEKPRLHAEPAEDPFLVGLEIVDTKTGAGAREQIDAAIEEAAQRILPLNGGGDIAVDHARGLTVIDVDSGDRKGEADPEMFALNLNLAAAEEAARQLSLRGIGGLVALDFVGMQQARNRRSVVDAFRKTLAGYLRRASEVLDMSQLGVCEAAIARRARPVAAALSVPAAEREALDALRLLESEGWNARGSRLHARLSADAAAWLQANASVWSDPLASRIGARWTIEAEQRPPGRPKVWSA